LNIFRLQLFETEPHIRELTRVIMESLAFAGTGDVLKVQKLVQELNKDFPPEPITIAAPEKPAAAPAVVESKPDVCFPSFMSIVGRDVDEGSRIDYRFW
jgi:hypothetical protein